MDEHKGEDKKGGKPTLKIDVFIHLSSVKGYSSEVVLYKILNYKYQT